MEIIVLSITHYKEKDAIITAINQNECFSFLAKGIFNPKNKNAGINNPLTISDIELAEGNFKYPVLKNATILNSPMILNTSSQYLASIMLLNEGIINLLADEDRAKMFSWLKQAIIALKANVDPYKILLIYFANIFKFGGYEFEVNRCVKCGNKKDIVIFSFLEGGFICKNCLENEQNTDLNKNQMLLLREAFNANKYELNKKIYNQEDAKYIFNKFIEFIHDSFGYNLKFKTLLD